MRPSRRASIPATLVFEKAGDVHVEFQVLPRDGAAHDMGDMPGMSH